MKKILIILFLILLITNVKADYNYTQFDIHPVNYEETFEYKNCIACRINLEDSTNNAISEISIRLYANDKDENGVSLNISDTARYTMTAQKTWFLAVPYVYTEQFLVFNNMTVVNNSESYFYIIPYDFKIDIKYDVLTSNTSFKVVPFTTMKTIEFDLNSNFYTGMPATSLNIVGLNKYDVKIKVINIPEVISIQDRISHLSWPSYAIYKILTLNGIIGQNSILLTILSFIDLFVLIMIIIFNLFFTYPYLLGVYLLTMGNFYTVFKMKSLRELVVYYSEYFSIVVKIFNYLFTKLLEFIIYILTLLKVI